MGLYNAYEVDRECVTKGIWLEITDPDTGAVLCKIRVRPADPDYNPDYRKAAADLFAKVAKKDPDADFSDDLDYMLELYARAVVTDWEGVTGPKGEELKCTEKNIIKVLHDLPQVRKIVGRMARDWKNFRKEFEEAAVKN